MLELQSILRALHVVGSMLWTGGLVAAMFVAARLDPDPVRLQWSLELADRIHRHLLVPGMLLTVAAGFGFAALLEAPLAGVLAAKVVLAAIAAGASLAAGTLVGGCVRRWERRLEDIGWQRKMARELAGARWLHYVAVVGLAGAAVLSLV